MSTRRNFLKTLSGMALLTVVPRHVLGGPKHVAPSDQLTKGIIGVGGIGKSSYHFTSNDACRLGAACGSARARGGSLWCPWPAAPFCGSWERPAAPSWPRSCAPSVPAGRRRPTGDCRKNRGILFRKGMVY